MMARLKTMAILALLVALAGSIALAATDGRSRSTHQRTAA